MLQLSGLDADGRVVLQMWWDIEDIDAAMAELDAAHARFEEEHPRARRLENAASQVVKRLQSCFAARNWAAMAELLADDISTDDRRRVVSAGNLQGPDLGIESMHALVDIGVTNMTSTVMATRGERLVLGCVRMSGRDQRPEAFRAEALGVVEIDADGRIVANIAFDPDDFEAAVAELDARYLAGEAAAHAHTWSVLTGGHAAVNRHEPPPTTPDCVSIDHRRGAAFAPGELIEYLRAGSDLNQEIRTYVEVVHRLTDLGAVCTHAGQGVSGDGFDAEWRGVDLLTVDGDLVNRCEVFEEADLAAALARFDELSRPTPALDNAANRVIERYLSHFPTRDWDAMVEMLADDFTGDDRRRVVNSGIRTGRDAEIANVQVIAEAGVTAITSTAIATRGERLVLARHQFSARDWPEPIGEMVDVVEINADNQITSQVIFEADDFEAAIAELDARYLAGEGAAHAKAWSVIMQVYAALSRRELPPTTPDWADIDRRRLVAIEGGGMREYLRATWDVHHAGQYLHQVRASTERPRSGRHLRSIRDLARRLRRRVAGNRPSDTGRPTDQSLRAVR